MYRLVKSRSDGGLEEIVNKFIKRGWKPKGSPVCVQMERLYLVQAMVKHVSWVRRTIYFFENFIEDVNRLDKENIDKKNKKECQHEEQS